MHNSGPVWVANPSPYDSLIHYTSPVSPAHEDVQQCDQRATPDVVDGTVSDAQKTF
jgi:hypothetical protein